MAIYHLSMKPISRAKGRSAVAAMAYRAGERLTNERDGITHDFTAKQGVEHAEIVLPEGVSADWARDRSALWNAAEFAEARKDARVAREFELALPHELSPDERLEITRVFAQGLADRYGIAVDFAIHAPHDESDVRNHHAHVLATTRQVAAEGLGEKSYLERENKWLVGQGLPTTDVQLRDLRQGWEEIANAGLARAGLDLRIDHRSHLDRGLEIAPTEHMGVHATQMERRGKPVERERLGEDEVRRNAELIRAEPERVLSILTGEKSVFDRRDVARALHRYLNDDAQEFQSVFAKVMASPALVSLQAERSDPVTGEVMPARYSTREMIEIEGGMVAAAERLHRARSHGVRGRSVARAMAAQDAAIQRSAGEATAGLSAEQRQAIAHVTGPERIAAVVGFAGAGKSTMLAAAREAWGAEGYRVHGAALAGKAAEGLEESSGIESRTLASWARRWENGRGQLGRGDVFVIDEAGMVGSRQLAAFVREAEARRAKIVLVGDHEQLQAIGAGAPFRAIAEEVGHAELSEIRRQREDWQREASVAFATHRTAEGLAAYREHGAIRFSETGAAARAEIVRDYLEDRAARPEGSRAALAHRRADVRALNAEIRAELQARGDLPQDRGPEDGRAAGEGEAAQGLIFQTNDGARAFAPGDRIVFLENDRDLGVKNGMLGTVDLVQEGRPGAGPMIVATLDGGQGRSVAVPLERYRAIDHGYATTIHKTQGATVDRSFVLASGTMDRHLTYVAMTRHRDGVQLYAAQEEFAGRSGAGEVAASGRLVAHGCAPYEHDPQRSDSYFVMLEDARGGQRTIWGVDLERAMAEAAPEIGDRIGLAHLGSTPVMLPDGAMGERHTWQVRDGAALSWQQLEARLSRAGMKETTLDYTRDFADRRGIAERLGVRSEIDLDAARNAPGRREREAVSWADGLVPTTSDGKLPERGRDRTRDTASTVTLRPASEKDKEGPRAREHGGEKQLSRRGMFDGLRLTRTRASEARARAPETAAPERDGLAERLRPLSRFEQAVDHYARAWSAVEGNRREGLPVLEAQTRALREAGEQLDALRPGAGGVMASALQYDPGMRQDITELSGRARVDALGRGVARERRALADPKVRAERFVARWQDLRKARQQLLGRAKEGSRREVEGEMRTMATSLARDPQVEELLRARRDDLGVRGTQSLARDMERQLTWDQSRDRGGFEM